LGRRKENRAFYYGGVHGGKKEKPEGLRTIELQFRGKKSKRTLSYSRQKKRVGHSTESRKKRERKEVSRA